MYWCDDYICPVSSRLDKLEYSQHPCIPYDSDGDCFVCLQNEKEQHILAFSGSGRCVPGDGTMVCERSSVMP